MFRRYHVYHLELEKVRLVWIKFFFQYYNIVRNMPPMSKITFHNSISSKRKVGWDFRILPPLRVDQ